MEAAGILEYEQVQIVDVENGTVLKRIRLTESRAAA